MLHRRAIGLVSFWLLLQVSVPALAVAAELPARLIILRHAEKAKRPAADPPLTARGTRRAQGLLDALAGIPVDAIYATQYARTQETVRPLAVMHDLEIRIIKASQTRKLASTLLSEHPGQTVVVAGHSFTLPALLRKLGVRKKVRIRNRAYGDLYFVTYEGARRPSLHKKRFGP